MLAIKYIPEIDYIKTQEVYWTSYLFKMIKILFNYYETTEVPGQIF